MGVRAFLLGFVFFFIFAPGLQSFDLFLSFSTFALVRSAFVVKVVLVVSRKCFLQENRRFYNPLLRTPWILYPFFVLAIRSEIVSKSWVPFCFRLHVPLQFFGENISPGTVEGEIWGTREKHAKAGSRVDDVPLMKVAGHSSALSSVRVNGQWPCGTRWREGENCWNMIRMSALCRCHMAWQHHRLLVQDAVQLLALSQVEDMIILHPEVDHMTGLTGFAA